MRITDVCFFRERIGCVEDIPEQSFLSDQMDSYVNERYCRVGNRETNPDVYSK